MSLTIWLNKIFSWYLKLFFYLGKCFLMNSHIRNQSILFSSQMKLKLSVPTFWYIPEWRSFWTQSWQTNIPLHASEALDTVKGFTTKIILTKWRISWYNQPPEVWTIKNRMAKTHDTFAGLSSDSQTVIVSNIIFHHSDKIYQWTYHKRSQNLSLLSSRSD